MIKKFILPLAGFVTIAFGAMYLMADSSSEFSAVLDQLNPMVKETNIYVKTKEPDDVNEYGTARYRQKAAYADGKTRTVEFNGISTLKTDRYLELTNKGAHVETYEEVSKDKVPATALEQIDK